MGLIQQNQGIETQSLAIGVLRCKPNTFQQAPDDESLNGIVPEQSHLSRLGSFAAEQW